MIITTGRGRAAEARRAALACPGHWVAWPDGTFRCSHCKEILKDSRQRAKPAAAAGIAPPAGIRRKSRKGREGEQWRH
jgi:hypothetical protein